jgi:hypothetical protein
MTNELALQDRIDQARSTAGFLDDPKFKKACQRIRDKSQDDFRSSAQGEGGDLQRRTAHLKLVLMEEILTELMAVVQDGAYAQAELDQLRKVKK